MQFRLGRAAAFVSSPIHLLHHLRVCRTTIGDRAFFVAAPRVWNTLPSSVTASKTLGTFKRRLKTHLFATSLPYFFQTAYIGFCFVF